MAYPSPIIDPPDRPDPPVKIPDDNPPPAATPDPPSPVPSIVASLQASVPPSAGFGDSGSDDSSPPDGGLTLPFIPPSMSKEQADTLRKSDIKILDDEIGVRASMQRDLEQRDREFEAR